MMDVCSFQKIQRDTCQERWEKKPAKHLVEKDDSGKEKGSARLVIIDLQEKCYLSVLLLG